MQVGYHVSRKEVKDASNAISTACDVIKTYGFIPSLQIFVTNTQTSATLFDDKKLEEISKTVSGCGGTLYVHGAYINSPWSKSEKACNNIVREMTLSEKCGALGLVIHLSKEAHGENLSWVLNYINGRIKNDKVILFLEVNTAKSSPFTFETPEKLHALIRHVKKIPLNYKVGLCIDTAHLFSCGTPLAHTSDVEPWFEKLMTDVMDDVPLLLHLNDSRMELGCGKDKHQKLCLGEIWDRIDDDCGLKSVLEWTQKYDVPIILERNLNGEATNDLEILQKWHDHGTL